MAESISWEVREQAEELYIVDGLTLEQAAKRVGVSVQALKNWSADDGWVQRRREYRETLRTIRAKRTELRRKLLEKAVDELDPQLVYAATRLETTAQRIARQDAPEAEVDRPKLFLEDMEFVADVLKEIDPEGLRVLARNFDEIVRRFKSHLAGETSR